MSEARRTIKAHHTGTQERNWPGKWRGCSFTQKGWQALTQCTPPGTPFPNTQRRGNGADPPVWPCGGFSVSPLTKYLSPTAWV